MSKYDLNERFGEELEKAGESLECSLDVGYPTNFVGIDYRNGKSATGFNPKTNEFYNYNILGITDGSMSTIIGRTHCGKSTFVTQVAGEIIRPFTDMGGIIAHDDVEVGMILERKLDLLKFNEELYRKCYRGRNDGVTTDSFFNRFKTIARLKHEAGDRLKYDTGLHDRFGQPIIKYVPSVYILDSIAMMVPEKFVDEDELNVGFQPSTTAKFNNQVFTRIIPIAKKYNIILLSINHIRDDISDRPKKASMPYLKQGETLPGGKTANYSASNMFRINDGNKLEAGESKQDGNFDIDGTVVDFEILKSRTNKAGKSVPIVFNQDIGFDKELSLFMLLKKNKKINGAGRGFYVGDLKDVKFSQKEFKNKFNQFPELRKEVAIQALGILNGFIKENDIENAEEEKEVMNMYEQSGTMSLIELANS